MRFILFQSNQKIKGFLYENSLLSKTQ